jgi:hypothetical protein
MSGLVSGDSRTVRCFWPLRCWSNFFQQHRSGRKYRTVRELPLTNPLIQLKRRPWRWTYEVRNTVEQIAFFLQHRSGRKHRTVRVLPLTNPLIQLKRRPWRWTYEARSTVEQLTFSYNTVAAGSIEQYVYNHLPIRSYSLRDAPEDGPVRTETL